MTSTTPDPTADDPGSADVPTVPESTESTEPPAEPTPPASEAPSTSEPPHVTATPASEPSIWDNPPESPLPEGYYTEDGTPTFDAVRARIEQRSATADGREELDSELPRERDLRKEQDDLKKAGADRLEQLRKSMGLEK